MNYPQPIPSHSTPISPPLHQPTAEYQNLFALIKKAGIFILITQIPFSQTDMIATTFIKSA